MSKVCGPSEEARALSSLLGTSMKALEQCTQDLDRGASAIRDGWKDEEVAVIEELVNGLKNALRNAGESIPNFQKALNAYADFLDRRMSNG